MLTDTLSQGLSRYGIGEKLRRLRLRKSMGLVELGRHTALSPALLSKLERGVMHPTLPTLLRIAMVFSVGLEYFFNAEPKPVFEIVRRVDRLRFPATADSSDVAYHFESLDFPVPDRPLSAYFAEFHAIDASSVQFHEHPGIEFFYVVSGTVELRTQDRQYEIGEGDAVYFDSSVPHGYRRLGEVPATALVVSCCER